MPYDNLEYSMWYIIDLYSFVMPRVFRLVVCINYGGLRIEMQW